MGVALVVPAAGNGSRFGGPICKQLLPLAGRPVLLHALDRFRGLVDAMVVVVAADLKTTISQLLAAEDWGGELRIVDGGATRRASVHAGLLATDPTCDRILIHDAARPLVPRACISACIRALDDYQGAVVALPCAATVKQVGDDGIGVVRTVPRHDLHLAQTPQGLRRDPALTAFARAEREDWPVTDDVEVLERAGATVAVVAGDVRNLKITTPADMALAAALLAAEADEDGSWTSPGGA